MKHKFAKVGKLLVKTSLVLTLLIASSLLFVSYKAEKIYADLWLQLGISKEDGTKKIKESFMYGYLQYYGARNFKKIATGDRATVAKELLAYTRQYLQSEAFKKEYAAWRNQARPTPPPAPKTEAEIRKERIAETKQSIAELEKSLQKMDAQYKKAFEDGIAMQKKQLKEYEDPNNKTIKYMVQSEQANYEYKMKEHDARMKKWETQTPENPLGMIKNRLREMFDITKDVDYNAELTEKYGKKVFVNPAYERKHRNWKYAFRAGKEVTETVRAFAQQWLSEIK